MARTTAPSNVRLRPLRGVSASQEKDFDKLFLEYADVFRILGRAHACDVPFLERMTELRDEIERRYALNEEMERGRSEMAIAISAGLEAGMRDRPNPFDKAGKTVRASIPCELIPGLLAGLRLPDVPESLPAATEPRRSAVLPTLAVCPSICGSSGG